MTRMELLRLKQIRFTNRFLKGIEAMPGGERALGVLARQPIVRPAFNWLVGFHRVFNSLEEAVAAARPFAEGGHENPGNATLHLMLSESPRPSDYAALFHIQKLIRAGLRIFDFGGNVGNLFYCYDRMLKMPGTLIWQVYELPEMIERGKSLAAARGEKRLQFTTNWEDASGADLLIASGSLHYSETPLADKVAKLAERPSHILINRTPLIVGATKATVQDAGQFRVGCVLYNTRDLLDGFEAIGYETVDSWQTPELNLHLVGHREYSACPPYSGIYLRLKSNA